MQKGVKIFSIFVFIVTLLTLGASIFYSSAFITSFMLMLSLFLFSIAYMIREDKRRVVYILFTIGVLLIIGALVYTYMRLV